MSEQEEGRGGDKGAGGRIERGKNEINVIFLFLTSENRVSD